MELLEEDIIKDAEKFFKLPYNHPYTFSEYDLVYLFTNEKIDYILNDTNLSGKLLTVTASADQTLNAILMGAREVQMFDINKFTKYFAELKMSAIKNLSYEDFLKLYNMKLSDEKALIYTSKKHKINKEILINLCEKMDETYALFFTKLLELSLFDSPYDPKEYFFTVVVPKYNSYLDKNKYYELQLLLKDVKVDNYIDCDIFD